MRKALFVPLAAVAMLGLSACGNKAKNEAAEANESIGGDSNTMGEAVSDVNSANAAEAAAFSEAENAYSAPAGDEGNEITD
jgi:hypothetical protein